MLLCRLGKLIELWLGGLGVFCNFCRTSFRSSWYFIEDVVLKVCGNEGLVYKRLYVLVPLVFYAI